MSFYTLVAFHLLRQVLCILSEGTWSQLLRVLSTTVFFSGSGNGGGGRKAPSHRKLVHPPHQSFVLCKCDETSHIHSSRYFMRFFWRITLPFGLPSLPSSCAPSPPVVSLGTFPRFHFLLLSTIILCLLLLLLLLLKSEVLALFRRVTLPLSASRTVLQLRRHGNLTIPLILTLRCSASRVLRSIFSATSSEGLTGLEETLSCCN